MRAAINKSRARQWRAGVRRRKGEHGCLRWSREGSLFEGPEGRDGRGLGNKSWVDLGKERIPGGGNKYEMKSEHNWDVQRTAEEPPGSYLERMWAGRQIIWVPEGPDGDSGFYSECRGKPSKNFGWESDIIRYVF